MNCFGPQINPLELQIDLASFLRAHISILSSASENSWPPCGLWKATSLLHLLSCLHVQLSQGASHIVTLLAADYLNIWKVGTIIPFLRGLRWAGAKLIKAPFVSSIPIEVWSTEVWSMQSQGQISRRGYSFHAVMFKCASKSLYDV